MISKLPIDLLLLLGLTALVVLMALISYSYAFFVVRPIDKEITKLFYQRFGCYPPSVELYFSLPKIKFFYFRNYSYYQVLLKEKNQKFLIKQGITCEQYDFIRALPSNLTAPLLKETILSFATGLTTILLFVSGFISMYFN